MQPSRLRLTTHSESFIQQYFSKMMVKVAQWLQNPITQQQQAHPGPSTRSNDIQEPPPPYTMGSFH